MCMYEYVYEYVYEYEYEYVSILVSKIECICMYVTNVFVYNVYVSVHMCVCMYGNILVLKVYWRLSCHSLALTMLKYASMLLKIP